MGIAEAIVILANVTSSGITLLQQAQVISQMISKANAEGRTTFTDDEWKLIVGADDTARALLEAAIAKAR